MRKIAKEFYTYGNGIVVQKDTIDKITNNFIQNIKNELPKEAQNITVIDSILSTIQHNIHLKTLKL